jgi:ribonuclease VapC
MMEEPEYVLDASAVLALIQNEPGADRVAGMLATAAISAVNLAEVITILVRRSGDADAAVRMLLLLNLQVLAWGESSAHHSRMFAYLADAGLSLGDRACITEVMRFKKTRIATTDRTWKKVRSVAARVILVR